MDRPGLPFPLTPFIGRVADTAAATDLVVRDEVRILTLSGPAGVGKTRLAIEVARHAQARLGCGVLFVPLAEVRQPEGVMAAVLECAGGADVGAGTPLETVAALLAGARRLLVLDNVEHVIDAAAEVAQLVERCPGLTVLATSRRPLELAGEHRFLVDPLPVPDGDVRDVEAVLANDALALLVARLRAADARFELRDMDVSAAVDLCRRLEGLPLALELAAARSRSLSLAAIRDALSSGLSVLTAGNRDQPARQRTMRAAIAWSYDLLDAAPAAVLRRLSVCVGGGTLETVRALAVGLELTAMDVLDVVDQLVAHNLLQREGEGGDRYRMLEVVREYAGERLVAAGEAADAHRLHALHVLGIAEGCAGELAGPGQVHALDRLQQDAPNLTAAVRWAVSDGEAELALRLCLSLRMLWYVRGSLAEGRSLFAAALAVPGGDAELRARVLVEASTLARHRGELAEARDLVSEALRLARDVADDELLAAALLHHGFVLHLSGAYDAARRSLEESLTLAQAAADALGTARALHHLGLVAHFGDGDTALSWDLQCRALAIFRRLGNDRHVAATLISLVEIARERRRLRAARELLLEAVETVRRVSDTPLLVYALRHAAALAADENRLTRATRLLGAAEGLEEASGAAPWPAVEQAAARWLPRAESSLGRRRAAAVRDAGRRLDAAEAAAIAVDFDDDAPDALSRREREVAELVSLGLTNRAIAERLVLSERTVDGHMARVLAKLECSSRAQVAARIAAERGGAAPPSG